VLVDAVQNWLNGTLRARREAQESLFHNNEEFKMICSSAGLDWIDFRARLLTFGRRVHMEGALDLGFAA